MKFGPDGADSGTRTLRVSEIRRDGETQVRVVLDSETVDNYLAAIDRLPPPVVFHDGTSYWLADGYHRVGAHMRAGHVEIVCEVREGTVDDARLYATSEATNGRHGRPLTTKDKRRAVRMALAARGDEWSDRQIAEHVGVDNKTVAAVKRKLRKFLSQDATVENRTGVGAVILRRPTKQQETLAPSDATEADPISGKTEVAAGRWESLPRLVSEGLTDKEIGKRLGFSKAAVTRKRLACGLRKTSGWKSENEVTIGAKERRGEARELLSQGMTNESVARKMGIHESTVAKIKRELGMTRGYRGSSGPLISWADDAAAAQAAWESRVADDRAPWKMASTEDLKSAEGALRKARTAISKAITAITREMESR